MINKIINAVINCCSINSNKTEAHKCIDGYVEDLINFDTVIIEDGCLVCNSCETIFPIGFKVNEENTQVLGGIRKDGISSSNIIELSPLIELSQENRNLIYQAYDGCCVNVIKLMKKSAQQEVTCVSKQNPTTENRLNHQ